MIELLSTLTITQALFYLALIAIAAKEVFVIKDYFKKKADDHYAAKDAKAAQIDNILKEIKNLQAEMQNQKQAYENLNVNLQQLNTSLNEVKQDHQEKLQILIKSDMDAIKSFIVKEHHHFIEEKWIDDFSLDTIEKRYTHYKEEGGNSYVTDLMKDLRDLPNKPPKE